MRSLTAANSQAGFHARAAAQPDRWLYRRVLPETTHHPRTGTSQAASATAAIPTQPEHCRHPSCRRALQRCRCRRSAAPWLQHHRTRTRPLPEQIGPGQNTRHPASTSVQACPQRLRQRSAKSAVEADQRASSDEARSNHSKATPRVAHLSLGDEQRMRAGVDREARRRG